MVNLSKRDTPLVSNVLAVYNGATAHQIREGLTWYHDAHNFARILAGGNSGQFGFDAKVARAAGVIAAISPNTSWSANKTLARKAYVTGGAGVGFPDKVTKVTRILSGEHPLDVLGGDKVRSFYSTILDPHGDTRPTIDRHAFDIAVGERRDESDRGALGRKGVYEVFADVYRDAARIAGIGAPQMQAITWVTWKEALGILV